MKLVQMLLSVIVLNGCLACGAERDVDPELKVLLDHYLKFAPNEGKLDQVDSIQFGELDSDERGSCDHYAQKIAGKKYDERRKIVVDPRGVAPVAVVLFHELGHCLHDLPHAPQGLNIMAPVPAPLWTPEEIDTGLQLMFLGVSR